MTDNNIVVVDGGARKKRKVNPEKAEIGTSYLTTYYSYLLQLSNIQLSATTTGTSFSYSTVTKLDLFQCNLSILPLSLPHVLPNLNILFCMKNKFTEMPAVIGKCSKLEMVSFKSNQLTSIHPDALDRQMKWLILTDNSIERIPDTISRCVILQKLMLSGNRIKELPLGIANCRNLELVRLASNALVEPPMTLLALPNLAWIAISDNPFLNVSAANTESQATSATTTSAIKIFSDDRLDDPESGEIIGSGASGITRKYTLETGHDVAVKEYKGTITSDGNPEEERKAALLAWSLGCDSLIEVLGETKKGSLVMQLLTKYEVFAGPPSMQSCSRDVYDSAASGHMTLESAVSMIGSLLQALTKLHQNGLCHGDFYGHNILVSTDDRKRVWLTDFGAAFFYDQNHAYGTAIELIERRAFSHLVEEIADLLVMGDQERQLQHQPSAEILRDFAGLCDEFSFTTLTSERNELKSSIM